MEIRHLSILGVGLLGGSLGIDVRARIKGCQVTGYGHRIETLKKAIGLGAIDHAAGDLTQAVRDADCVVLCTPVGRFDELLSQIAPALKPGAIVTDVGSTKRSVVQSAAKRLPKGVHFVGSHPMAGSEKRGIEFARAGLFDGSVCITTPAADTDGGAVEAVEGLWRTLGMKVIRMSADAHDQRVALVSHLPHALAAAIVSIQDDASLALAGKGFLDATRIAAGDGALWRDILIDNADSVRTALLKLMHELDHFAGLLRPEKSAELKQWLDQMADQRKSM